MEPAKVGIIGCGDVCGDYLRHAKPYTAIEMAACANRTPGRAEPMAAEHGVPKACSIEELLADRSIDIVLNLTTPNVHFEIAMRAIEAGKHVYNEKPLAIELDDARALLAAAKAKGVRVGCAPDTFLGGGIQTCLKLLNDGVIGEPVAATAFWVESGPEAWHPSPDFLFKYGAGPMLDIGPYFITALVALMGPVRRVSGMAGAARPTRTVGSGPLKGSVIDVEVPTHVAGTLQFDGAADRGGAISTIIQSWDVQGSELPLMEVYGTHGTLSVPNPSDFGGTVRLIEAGSKAWREVPLTHEIGGRSLGVADMACAIRSGRPHRAGGELALHVLEVMHAFERSSSDGRTIELTTTCVRPEPLPAGLSPGVLDA
ncbi:MAG: Gfo/Idh/MocA family oxidoreductase [Verrucomicrobia bacterium]|nr:Gfo/Idh/MocA family oxidoreductase [Verrucomicrobiota bacterium]